MVPTIIDENGVKKEEELMVERTVKLNRQGEAAVVFSNDELKRHKLLHVSIRRFILLLDLSILGMGRRFNSNCCLSH